MFAIAALHCATLMALPLTVVGLGSKFAGVPVVVGVVLEILRAALRQGLKAEVRSTFMREAALRALDKRQLVPDADVDSAFWAAYLTERAITVDLPALLAASLAGASILALASRSVAGGLVGSLLTLFLLSLGLTIWSNKRRAPAVDAAVEHRQHASSWVAAAERDGGEINAPRSRSPFLDRLAQSVQLWSAAERQVERERLRYRVLLGALFLVGVLAILRSQNIDPLHLALDPGLRVGSLSGLLFLSTGIPVGYVFAIHADSLLTDYAALTQLLSRPVSAPVDRKALERRPLRLTARALCFSYPSSRPVLANVDFEVDLRRLTLVVAPNGAGKTTLARLICGVLTPDGGTLELDGVPCAGISRDDFGFVPQNPLIVETLSIEGNVRLVAPEARREAIEQLLGELGLQRPLHQLAGELSRGQQRRVAIARAILKQPRLLLLDEPDVWLDASGRGLLAAVLHRQLAARAVVVVSHREDWLPSDAAVIDLAGQALPPISTGTGSLGKSSAWG